MQSSLDRLSLFEQWKIHQAVGFSVTTSQGQQAFHESIRDAIPILEARVKRDGSREWAFWYMLSDWYSTLGDYANAVRAAEKCFELRRRDPRSRYALASELRMLTHARLSGQPELEKIQELGATSGMDIHGQIDPQRSQQALDELGITIDVAATRSLELFDGLLEMGIDPSSRRAVCDTLASMYLSFPSLEDQKNTSLKVSTSPNLNSRNNPFEEAVMIYDSLRTESPDLSAIMSSPDRYKARAIEVIRLSQLAIQTQVRVGDAYVLLANAYFLACRMTEARNCPGAYGYCHAKAISLLFEWEVLKTESEQREYGESMLQGIRDGWSRAGLRPIQIKKRAQEWRDKYLASALGPNVIRILSGVL